MRHKMRAPIINSIKHYVHQTNTLVGSGTILNHNIVDAVVAPASSSAEEVTQGSVIKAVYIERWLIGGQTVPDIATQFNLTVEKINDVMPAMSFAQSANLGSYINKKNILYTTQGILSGDVNNAQSVPVIRTWVMIPKGKQRFGLADQLVINISAISDLRVCGIETYKEYR